MSVMKMSILRILLILFSAALATAQGGSYPKPQIGSAKGQQAPDFTLQDQDGRAFTLSQQQGHWVLLFFYRGYW
jgi:cytochrome oxidase Cu insertion factor (SCO1/SenC/PrrC family)